jgi:hypothetical protein
LDLDQAQIGRHLVARLQLHQIARHQGFGFQRHQPSVAPDHGVGREHLTDRLERVLGLALLHEADGGIDEHHAEDDAGVEPVLQQRRDRTGGQQHIDEDVVELTQEAQQGTLALGFREEVGSIAFQALAGSRVRQSLLVAVESRQGVFRTQGVPVLRRGG